MYGIDFHFSSRSDCVALPRNSHIARPSSHLRQMLIHKSVVRGRDRVRTFTTSLFCRRSHWGRVIQNIRFSVEVKSLHFTRRRFLTLVLLWSGGLICDRYATRLTSTVFPLSFLLSLPNHNDTLCCDRINAEDRLALGGRNIWDLNLSCSVGVFVQQLGIQDGS